MSKLSSSAPVIVTAADGAFALPVAVMLRSVVDHLKAADFVHAYVLDCGMSAVQRHKIRRSVPTSWMRVEFIRVEEAALQGLRVDGHVSAATYARLLMESLLPAHVQRCMYIDGDMLLLNDISVLWCVDLRECLVAAVQDPVAGIVGEAPQMMHWEGWDVPTGTPVFNAGLMVVELAGWRKADLSRQALDVARKHPERMRWWDQCALNYLIRGNFTALSPKWNVMPHVYYPPHCSQVVYDAELTRESIADPWCIHFSGIYRPWRGANRHWRDTDFYRHLYRTAFRNDVYCAPWMGRGKTIMTKVKRALQERAFIK